MAAPVRNLVLDNEGVSALLGRSGAAKRATVLEAIMAANGRVLVASAVRVEARWSRRDPSAAAANQLVPDEDPLDRAGADRASELCGVVRAASVVDATVAVAAERSPSADVVEILTSDTADLTALAAQLGRSVVVRRL